ncbi:MAG: bifunctional phosphoribosylaminoimidazolecarboxamide formyltransferase/IMP cyclohydrolase [Thermoplasmataceae archaeon]
MRALISVYNKSGLIEFVKSCGDVMGEIYATGSTGDHLRKNGISARSTSELTGFEELLGGRVKTLHPRIFAGILSDYDSRARGNTDYPDFDIVICNFYPFRSVSEGNDVEKMIENIDIGGVSLVRAAAKNYANVAVLSDPADYPPALESIRSTGNISDELRKELALKAFQRVADYDILIHNSLQRVFGEKSLETLLISGVRGEKLRYGENPDQRGYVFSDGSSKGIANARKLNGKELSYNNLMDADSAFFSVMEFEVPACMIIKHNTPCGAATGKDLTEAFTRALSTDTESAYGSVIGFNMNVDASTAAALSSLFVEVVVSPGYSKEAISILRKKKNLRVLEVEKPLNRGMKVRSISGGFLLQDDLVSTYERLELKTDTEASPSEIEDLKFAWKVVTHCRSNAIVLAKNGCAVAIGAGQTSRVEALRIAINKAGEKAKGSVMASDAYFPFSDSVEIAGEHGISSIIQPGGSIRDEEVIAMAKEKHIPMYFTGKRVFLH